MTKAKTTRAQLPAQTNDAAPPPNAGRLEQTVQDGEHLKSSNYVEGRRQGWRIKPNGDAEFNPEHDESGAPPELVSVDVTVTTPLVAQRPPNWDLGIAAGARHLAAQVDADVLADLSGQPRQKLIAPVLANFTRLEQARGIPEVVGEVDTHPVEFAPGSIQRFKAGEDDRRTMEIIALPGAGFACRAVPDANQSKEA